VEAAVAGIARHQSKALAAMAKVPKYLRGPDAVADMMGG
jgi:hypothetical protein